MIKFTITIQEGKEAIGCRGDAEHFKSTEDEKWYLAMFLDAFHDVEAAVRDVAPEGFLTIEGKSESTGSIIDRAFNNL